MVGYKEEKELFVSGLEGTSPHEILLLIAVLPLGTLCCVRYHHQKRRRLVEVVALLVPLILSQTVWLYPWGLVYLGIVLVLLALIPMLLNQTSNHKQENKNEATTKASQDRAAMTIYRAGLLCMTCIAILAVDFHIFPRRYAKTERLGYSLMDSGAASFIVAAGWVGGRKKQRHSLSSFPWRRLGPLLVLGSLRFWTHQELEYQEHVSEYGVQWNFFATLAVVTAFVAMFPPRPYAWLPSLVALSVYQVALSFGGLQEWIEEAPRTCKNGGILCNLLVGNREGVLGCIGYLSLYYLCAWISHMYYWSTSVNPKQSLWKVTGLLFILWRALVAAGVPVSRRSTNAAFCAWVLFLNVAQISAIRAAIGCSSHIAVPPILTAINSNGLLTFVIANLLTGAVNLSMDTFHASNGVAIVVLVVYMSAVSGIAVALDIVKHSLRGDSSERTKQK